jgi:hypothetical protein
MLKDELLVEGRSIRALEATAGQNIVDDTPEAIILSVFLIQCVEISFSFTN